MAAFAARGLRVASAKVGPDFIDPGYHGLATGRPGRNLDPWMSGVDMIPALAARASRGADLLIVEGVMGLFDGANDGSPSSTADVARMLAAPVVLVVDASSMSRSVAAIVHGFRSFDADTEVGGVILNRVASDTHEELLRRALVPLDIPILGAIRRDDELKWRDRHLGLVPVAEQPRAVSSSLDRLAVALATSCDLDAILRLARTGRPVDADDLPRPQRVGRAVVAVPSGPVFGFVYPDNLEALELAGAELVPFDPINDIDLPTGADALYVGGGFPEVFAAELSANAPLLRDVRRRVARGLVTWAECGGLLWLSQSLGEHCMAGVLDAHASMTERLTLGYRDAVVERANPVGAVGERLRGHEFHYSTTSPAGDALKISWGDRSMSTGFSSPTLLASYLHLHLGATPRVAERFVARAAADRSIASPGW